MNGITDERLAELIAEVQADLAIWPDDANQEPKAFFLEELSAYQELQQRRSADRWIPVSERLPEQGQKVLTAGLWCGGGRSPRVSYYDPRSSDDFPWRDGYGGGDGPSVTHWRPLPAAPVTERKEP